MTFITNNLQISETLLRAVINTAVDGIMVIDDSGAVRLYNTACERLFGYTAEEVVGHNVKMLMPASYRGEHDRYLQSYRETGKARIIGIGREVTGQRKDGSQFPIGLSVGEAWHDDQRYFVGIVHDITMQKSTEEKLLNAKEEAESANRAKSDFLAVMSHEIRTPLNGIMATTSLLQHTKLKNKQLNYSATIQQSCESLLEIVNSILDLAKIESGAVELKESWFELRDLMESVEYLWQPRVREKDLEFFTKIEHEVPTAVICDADRIREILSNLVNNAVKFTDTGYIAIKVSVDSERDVAEAGRVRLCFEVMDTGIGIETHQQALLFERFEQADTSLTRQHGGSGLGLAICKELSELLDGDIGVVSEPGKGSRFWFTVTCRAVDASPSKEKVAEVEASPVGARDAGRPLTILVAEDSPTNQVIIRDILEFFGHHVDIAPNGREAVQAARRGDYDLILMDVRMPIMDGLEATRQIRHGLPEGTHPPIIALTAHAMQGVREQCLGAGMNGYVTKPFTVEKISEIVSRYRDDRAA